MLLSPATVALALLIALAPGGGIELTLLRPEPEDEEALNASVERLIAEEARVIALLNAIAQLETVVGADGDGRSNDFAVQARIDAACRAAAAPDSAQRSAEELAALRERRLRLADARAGARFLLEAEAMRALRSVHAKDPLPADADSIRRRCDAAQRLIDEYLGLGDARWQWRNPRSPHLNTPLVIRAELESAIKEIAAIIGPEAALRLRVAWTIAKYPELSELGPQPPEGAQALLRIGAELDELWSEELRPGYATLPPRSEARLTEALRKAIERFSSQRGPAP